MQDYNHFGFILEKKSIYYKWSWNGPKVSIVLVKMADVAQG